MATAKVKDNGDVRLKMTANEAGQLLNLLNAHIAGDNDLIPMSYVLEDAGVAPVGLFNMNTLLVRKEDQSPYAVLYRTREKAQASADQRNPKPEPKPLPTEPGTVFRARVTVRGVTEERDVFVYRVYGDYIRYVFAEPLGASISTEDCNIEVL